MIRMLYNRLYRSTWLLVARVRLNMLTGMLHVLHSVPIINEHAYIMLQLTRSPGLKIPVLLSPQAY